jgi:FHA domain
VAIPDDTGPDGCGPVSGSGRPGEPGRVSDADWSRVVAELTGSAEARGTQDSFLQHVGPLPQQHADPLRQQADREGNGATPRLGSPQARGPGWLGAGIVASAAAAWRRALAGINRWLRKPPASLTLPAGSQARFTIGREPACDMTLLDRTVSRWHACLKREDDGWLLTDLGSTNGTRLNGWRVHAPITVSPGDLVSFGAATFVLTERPGRMR